MSKILKKDARQLLALTANIKPPTTGDIDLVKVAAIKCKSSQEFCEFLEMEPAIFNYWCKTYPSYRKAVWAWRDVATNEIEVAMAKRAIGFKKTTRRDVVTKTGQVETLINETYYPPDTAAAQFWLKNRAPNDWQDKKEIDVNLNANIRAWLVSAGGQLDPSEIIDGIATEVIAAELEDNSQQLLEAEMISDLIEEVATANETEAAPAVKLEDEVKSSPDLFAGLNSGWSK